MARQMVLAILFLLVFGSTKCLKAAVEIGVLVLEDDTLTNISIADPNIPDTLATETPEASARTLLQPPPTNLTETLFPKITHFATTRNSYCKDNKQHTMCKYKVSADVY